MAARTITGVHLLLGRKRLLCLAVEYYGMYRVLCPVDTQRDRARAQAEAIVELATVTDEITVDVLYVHEKTAASEGEWAAGGFAEEYLEEMTENVDQYGSLPDSVDTVAAVFEDAGIVFGVHETEGEPASAILTVAEEFDSDAIVLAARSRSPVGKVLFGSVAQSVLLDSDVPVTVVSVE